ncbi:cytochrome c4 [Glaciecola punicea ACAM 611]|jgi:cytochrome c553|uniref:Cytochrome c4 n=1 Tax=Glaciecola punicea ACAM 611 TaxID=1121923 RepID=H5TDW0_9ALTE|nr:c-type cytochrome [Glaciecola punicea]OFA31033.1 cytochrome C [Glaciecola punicea]GAB56487.1 cytochrome c4 [Glaciecola punicea ACAM 611]
MKKYCLILALFVATTAMVQAKGDAEAGKTKMLVCAACHGTDGNSVIPMNPKLAGQHQGYLVKQLQEFKLASQTGGKEGRNNAIMNGQAMMLSEQDMYDLSAYFSSQDLKIGETPEDVIARGEALYRGGDSARGIAACIACHGGDGKGMNLAGFPVIGGQHATYTKTQLEMFRSGERHNDLNGMMRGVAVKLTDEDISVLSQYLEGLY